MSKVKQLILNNNKIENIDQLRQNLTPELFEKFRSGELSGWLQSNKLTLQEKVIGTLFLENSKREEQLLDTLYQTLSAKPETDESKSTYRVDGKTELEFIARDDGTAIDSATGLLWCRFLIGQQWGKRQAFGDAKEMPLNEAEKAIEEFNQTKFGGFNDWRLPHHNELKRILGSDKIIVGNNKSLLGANETILFEIGKEKLWTASSALENSSISSEVNYYGGKVARSEISLRYTRLVRG